jgi:beta-1,3-galactosyltransferase 1
MKSLQVRDFVACFVISPPENSRMRDAVRQTWGKSMKAIFLVGRTDNETTNNFLTREAHEFNDVIIEDFIDSYDNLTIKTAFAFKNFLKHFNTSKHFFKIDDDAFLNVEGLHKHLQSVPENSLVGQSESHSIPIRDESHRWFIPEFLFEGDVFPPYLLGLSYLIPGKI